ncbi:flavodoxin family protein [Microbacterium dextranolyticum]|uniref:Flavodoxin n=1 Tax=Microbacterium dextranolyticum TaxID=36806 RepID=A0A9W6HL26_9MICO|nr:flavodoxin/nitric oxide synthase [Microbacterium dextranolyticum]MBM7463604.1 hypothetical protein [Microbacterium dextranolyticum]GLJ94706.1 flavodoxin [Microbacterium dextranolyticum]
MSALVVYESHFGNGRRIATAIADELDTEAVPVASAPDLLPEEIDLLVAGGPTHGLTLSTAASRASAHEDGGAEGVGGLAEWLTTVAVGPAPRVALFTTHTSPLSGSAAKAAKRLLSRRGVPTEAVTAFLVGGKTGPLREGELERARAWARSLRG